MPVIVGRVHKLGSTLVVTLPGELVKQFPLRFQDRIAIRISGETLIMQRIPLEQLARPAPVEGVPASG